MLLAGSTPLNSRSALVFMNTGKTRPGQSQSSSESDSTTVCRCFVLPGVAPTATRTAPCEVADTPSSTLISEDFPTFGNPIIPTTARRSAKSGLAEPLGCAKSYAFTASNASCVRFSRNASTSSREWIR